MIPLPNFLAVIFDMDGLLLDTESIAYKAWMQAAQKWGIELPDALYFQVIGLNLHDTEGIFKAHFGDSFPFHEVRQLRLNFGQELITEHGLSPRPGAVELLVMLNAYKVPKAVATSTAKDEAWRRLHLAELSQYFDILCGGDEVERGKPAPDLFLLAAQRMGIQPADCLVLEDSEYGVQAAREAGMTPLLIPDIKPPSDHGKSIAHDIFTSLHEVRQAMMSVLNPLI
ncbi:MAG: HAD family phosphatase [bacterium]|nr:HAD family phosphatase [bacterium]